MSFSSLPAARSAYTLNIETNQWTARTNIPHDYKEFSCNKVELPNGEKEVYFVGGASWGRDTREVQIFNLASNQWRKGKKRKLVRETRELDTNETFVVESHRSLSK